MPSREAKLEQSGLVEEGCLPALAWATLLGGAPLALVAWRPKLASSLKPVVCGGPLVSLGFGTNGGFTAMVWWDHTAGY